MYPNLAGNMGACCSGALISIIVTLIKPDNKFDWAETKRINPRGRANDQLESSATKTSDSSSDNPSSSEGVMEDLEKKDRAPATVHSVDNSDAISALSGEQPPEDYETLQRSLRAAIWASVAMSFIIVFVRLFWFLLAGTSVRTTILTTLHAQLIPIPMFLSHYVFSLTFFKAWMIICVIWLFIAAFITSVLPLCESRRAMGAIVRGVILALRRNEKGEKAAV